MSEPVIVVQGASSLDAVPHLARIAARCEVRLANGPAALRAALPGAEVMLGWDFRAGDLEGAWDAADRLRWIQWAGAGVDAALFPGLTRSPVVLTNARGIFDRAMAEYVLASVLALAKRIPETVRLQGRREWRHRLGERIDGRRAVVIGAGSIGRTVARLLRAAGMRVTGVARHARAGDGELEVVYAGDDLHRALARADYVIGVLPDTARTRGLIDAGALAAMRPGARLVNVGRGSTVDEEALVAALESGRLAGAALDVFAEEPLPADSPLWGMPTVLVSPHMSGDFEGYADDLGRLFAQNLARYRRGLPLLNVVDKARGY